MKSLKANDSDYVHVFLFDRTGSLWPSGEHSGKEKFEKQKSALESFLKNEVIYALPESSKSEINRLIDEKKIPFILEDWVGLYVLSKLNKEDRYDFCVLLYMGNPSKTVNIHSSNEVFHSSQKGDKKSFLKIFQAYKSAASDSTLCVKGKEQHSYFNPILALINEEVQNINHRREARKSMKLDNLYIHMFSDFEEEEEDAHSDPYRFYLDNLREMMAKTSKISLIEFKSFLERKPCSHNCIPCSNNEKVFIEAVHRSCEPYIFHSNFSITSPHLHLDEIISQINNEHRVNNKADDAISFTYHYQVANDRFSAKANILLDSGITYFNILNANGVDDANDTKYEIQNAHYRPKLLDFDFIGHPLRSSRLMQITKKDTIECVIHSSSDISKMHMQLNVGNSNTSLVSIYDLAFVQHLDKNTSLLLGFVNSVFILSLSLMIFLSSQYRLNKSYEWTDTFFCIKLTISARMYRNICRAIMAYIGIVIFCYGLLILKYTSLWLLGIYLFLLIVLTLSMYRPFTDSVKNENTEKS